MQTHVLVPLSSGTIIDIASTLAQRGAKDSIADFVEKAVAYTLDSLEWKGDEELPILDRSTNGFRWKTVFLPSGTKLRMRYGGAFHYAEVEGDHLMHEGKQVSPSEFTFQVTNTSRNAWRDIEVLRPGDPAWMPAERLR